MEEKDIKNEELEAMQADADEEVICVVLTDEAGNEHEFYQDMVIDVDGKQFAVLVPLDADCCCEDEECECHDHEHEHDEEDEDDNCVIARIDFDENGEAVYTAPTDEEYEAVVAKYDELFDGEEE